LFRDKVIAKTNTNITTSDTQITVDNSDFVNLLNSGDIITIGNKYDIENVKVISKSNQTITIQRIETPKSFPAGSFVYCHLTASKIFTYTFNIKGTVNANSTTTAINLTNITPLYKFSLSGKLDLINDRNLAVRVYLQSASYTEFTKIIPNKICFTVNFSSTTTTNASILRIDIVNNSSLPETFILTGILTGNYT